MDAVTAADVANAKRKDRQRVLGIRVTEDLDIGVLRPGFDRPPAQLRVAPIHERLSDRLLDDEGERRADIADNIRRPGLLANRDVGRVAVVQGETKRTVPPPAWTGRARVTASLRTIITPDAPGPPGNLCGDTTTASFPASVPAQTSMGR